MATASATPAPRWFKSVALVAILWNAFGVVMYLSTVGMFGDPNAGLSETERAASAAMPPWLYAAFAIGTFGGLIGSAGLFFRRDWALPMLGVSMLALLAMEGWIVFFSGTLDMYGLAVPIAVSVGSVFLVWLAVYARSRHLLN